MMPTSVVVDNSPVQHILLKFQVSGIAGQTVTRSTLRLYNLDASTIGGKFYRVNDQSWEEETVTWNNAPAHDNTLVASLGVVADGNWYEVDLTSLITADGTYSLRVSSTSSNGADYYSKEGYYPPVLEVETAGGPTSTVGPSVTPSETPTATLTATSTVTATATATLQPGAVVTFAPLDDASIHSGNPNSNYGASQTLLVDNSPVQHILLKFQVSGLAGQTITRATLRLYNLDASTIGGKFYRVTDQSWEEETVTWNNTPAHDGTLVASLGAVTNGSWYSVDLTSLITADGTYSLRVTSTSGDGADYRSKEGVNPPVLEVEVAGDATQTPAPTPTPTDTPTPTPTPTDTPTPTPTATSTPPVTSITYAYDGDGNMVKSEINGIVTYYVGKHYEKQVDGVNVTVRKYYTANGKSLAMRENSTLIWLLSDHLGSTSVTTDANGGFLSSLRYTAFGEVRAASGTTGTDYLYTGQREESELGLYYYVARWYDPALARFIQADSIVPGAGNPVAWDRYAYTLNNPIKYVDPSGHFVEFPQVIDFSNFYIPFNNGWDLLGAAISYVVSPVLPVHFESYGLGRGAIVGDTQAQIMEKGMMLFGVPNAISGIVPTRPFTVTSKPAPASRTPNEIGAWGEQQVGKNLPARIQQNRVTDPITGQTRIYDGSFIANQGAYIEVKTSTQPIIYASKSIKNQIAFDAGFGSNSGTMPVWIFVNGQPSRPLINLLQRNNIPWQQLHVPQ